MEQYRAAVKYDLLKHGFRLEWLGTELLRWEDAFLILTLQPPEFSALYREEFPEHFNHTKVVERLETIAVLILRGQQLVGKQSDVRDDQLISQFSDIWGPAEDPEDQAELLTFDEIDERIWGSRRGESPELTLLTFDEIDEKMGWTHGD